MEWCTAARVLSRAWNGHPHIASALHLRRVTPCVLVPYQGVNRPLTGGYGDSGGPTLPTTNSGGYGGTGGYGGAGGYGAPTPVHAAGVLGSEEQLVDSICTPAGKDDSC